MTERIIILSPGPANEAGFFHNWLDGAYLGGQTRMDAAVALARARPSAQCMLVGGYNTDGTTTSDKVGAMHGYIARQAPDVEHRLVDVPSLPCTYHNMVAALLSLRTDGWFEHPTQIGVLSNAYHLARAATHTTNILESIAPGSSDQLSSHIAFIGAEAVLGVAMDGVEAQDPAAYRRRMDMELKGLRDLDAGTYGDSCFDRYGESLRPVLAQHGPELLTAGELSRYGVLQPLG